ncbi:hypothetical protein [Streptomyces sp. NPDC053560]|uniref:hypothetical protein n=1 Tax=Streptomyces sp. NPDC053560 TaxID=3365711 RepID=UPI0037D6C406
MTGTYGDPTRWDEVPPDLFAAITAHLARAGWADTGTSEHTVTVPCDERATGLPEASGRGEHLYAVWGGTHPEWLWGTAHPDAEGGGHLVPLLARPDDAAEIAAQIVRVLRTGRALP